MSNQNQSIEGYPLFQPDQVLTSEDLNNTVDYLNRQIHLNRSKLVGYGVVQGMDVSFESSTKTVQISAGTGITQNGQLINITTQLEFSYYQSINQKDKQDTIIFELLSKGSNQKQTQLSEFPRTGKKTWLESLEPYVVLVLLDQEILDRRQNLLNYEEQGKDKQFRQRFFLVLKDEIQPASRSSIESAFLLPKIYPLGYQEGQSGHPDAVRLSTVNSYEKFKDGYFSVTQKTITSVYDLWLNWMLHFPEKSRYLPNLQALRNLKENLKQTLTTQMSEVQKKSYGYQLFYSHLCQIVKAYTELTQKIAEFVSKYSLLTTCPKLKDDKSFQVAVSPNYFSSYEKLDYLLLGEIVLSVLSPDQTSEEFLGTISADLDPYRHYFIPAVVETQVFHTDIQILQSNLVKLCRELALLRANSHGDVKVESKPDLTGVYRIQGHLGKACQDVWSAIYQAQQDHNLAFEIIYLKLPEPGAIAQPYHFHRFAEAYPGMVHLGGVPRGGTFILVYRETAPDQDEVVADFSLPYLIGQTTMSLQAPQTFTLKLSENVSEFQLHDLESKITLSPSDGWVEGNGVIERSGTYYFQPWNLQIDPKQKTVDILITGRWGRCVKTLPITVHNTHQPRSSKSHFWNKFMNCMRNLSAKRRTKPIEKRRS